MLVDAFQFDVQM